MPFSLSRSEYAAEATLKRELTELTKALTDAENDLIKSKEKRDALKESSDTSEKQKEIELAEKAVETQENNVKAAEKAVEIHQNDIKVIQDLRAAYEELKKTSNASAEELAKHAKEEESATETRLRMMKESTDAFAAALGDAGFAAEDVQKALKGFEGPLRDQEAFNNETARGAKEMQNLQNQLLNFFSVSNGWNLVRKVMRNAFNVVKDLDAGMTDSAVVTEMTQNKI